MGAGHENSRQGPLPLGVKTWCHARLLCHSFIKSGYCGVLKVRPCLKKSDRNETEMFEVSLCVESAPTLIGGKCMCCIFQNSLKSFLDLIIILDTGKIDFKPDETCHICKHF